MNQRSVLKSREGAWLWLFKIFAGLMLVLLLAVHFVMNHMVAPGGLLSYAEIIGYYQTWFVPGMEILFLLLVISHALVGLRSILLDLNPSDGLLRAANLILLLVGLGFSIYGIWLVIVIVQRG